jgi:hypothetical protein
MTGIISKRDQETLSPAISNLTCYQKYARRKEVDGDKHRLSSVEKVSLVTNIQWTPQESVFFFRYFMDSIPGWGEIGKAKY